MRSVAFRPLAGRAGLVVFAILLAVGLAARAETHDLEHQLSDARARAAEARTREEALAGDVAAQSEQIDAVETQIGGLRTEVAALERQLNQAQTLLGALERESDRVTGSRIRSTSRSARTRA